MQTLLLGLLGGVLGVALGVGVQMAFPHLLAGLLHMQTEMHVQGRTVLTGLAVGVLTTLLFTLPPLLDIRGVRPILILRRAVEESDDPFVTAIFRKLRKNVAQIGAAVLILAGLGGDCGDAQRFGDGGRSLFAGTGNGAGGLAGGFGAGACRAEVVSGRTRLSLPSAVRHGLANLYRPGNPSAALLAALGLGVMQIMTVYFVQQAVVRELHIIERAESAECLSGGHHAE